MRERIKRVDYQISQPPHVLLARVHYEIQRYFDAQIAALHLTPHEIIHQCRTEAVRARDSESYTAYLVYRDHTIAVGAYRHIAGSTAELLLASYLDS